MPEPDSSETSFLARALDLRAAEVLGERGERRHVHGAVEERVGLHLLGVDGQDLIAPGFVRKPDLHLRPRVGLGV